MSVWEIYLRERMRDSIAVTNPHLPKCSDRHHKRAKVELILCYCSRLHREVAFFLVNRKQYKYWKSTRKCSCVGGRKCVPDTASSAGIDVRGMLKQQTCHLDVAPWWALVQWSVARIVPRVHVVNAGFETVFDHFLNTQLIEVSAGVVNTTTTHQTIISRRPMQQRFAQWLVHH